MPALYLVGTPIGNLGDITIRALDVLRSVSLIACEDTRTTRRLLSHFDIHTRTLSYNEHNHDGRLPGILAALSAGDDVALVSEAGMPAISDPGEALVRAAAEAGFDVVPVPGPSAIVAALAASGLRTHPFTFVGFLPRASAERRRVLQPFADRQETLVLFEAPHRLRDAFEDMLVVLGDRRAAVCRELTKQYEEVFRGRLSEASEHFAAPRGEFTIVIEGASAAEPAAVDEDAVREELRALRDRGQTARQAIAQLALTRGLSRRDLYRIWLQIG